MIERLTDLIDVSGMVESRSRCEIIAEELLCAGVIVPPCRVGDVVYCTVGCTARPQLYEVSRIQYTKDYGLEIGAYARNQTYRVFHITDFGKTVFLAEWRAEKALAERSGE